MDLTFEASRALDHADPVAAMRAEFHFPEAPSGQPATYLCGNSLGLQPRGTVAEVARVLADWQRLAVRAHHGAGTEWLTYQDTLAPSLARLVGAATDEVTAMASLTINLHLLMASFYRPTRDRYAILIEAGSFPSDRYAMSAQLANRGFDPADALVQLAPREGERCLREEDIEAAIQREGGRLALVLLPGVQYLTGQCLDMARLARAAQAVGARFGLDLAHAVGNVPLALHDWGVDFAAWCSYKYLNGGPGATAGLFVHARHHDADLPRLAGWYGNELRTRFQFDERFVPERGAAGWQVSNGPILGMAPLRASLAQFDAVGIDALVDKSRKLTAYLEALIDARLGAAVEVLTPREPARRGAQLSLRARGGREAGRALFEQFTAAGVIGDWREPDVIRLAPAPLYNSFGDCWQAVEAVSARA
ncbi:MAG: kynureninase [Gammaproteobacteria bacterium]|nr:kynureninase [Gammaproteobacteria bacterium]